MKEKPSVFQTATIRAWRGFLIGSKKISECDLTAAPQATCRRRPPVLQGPH
jgi:hypothetical protein